MRSSVTLVVSNGYSLDFDQVSRILAALGNSIDAFQSRADLARELGLSERRVEGLLKLSAAMGILVSRNLQVTQLGKTILDHDAFLDDVGTLWCLHYMIGSNPSLYVWNRVINEVIVRNRVFDFELVKAAFADANNLYSGRTVMKRVQKEITTCLDAYTHQRFSYIPYLEEKRPSVYQVRDHLSIPPMVFMSAVAEFHERFYPGAMTIEIRRLANEPNSPGVVFNLPDRHVYDLLDEISRRGYLYVETRADLDQIRFRDEFDSPTLMNHYYEDR